MQNVFLHILDTPAEQIWNAVLIASAVFAVAKGGWPERVVGIALPIASVLSALVERRYDWDDPQWSVLVVDVLFLALLFSLAVRTDRRWLLFAAAFQLLIVVMHVAIFADRSIGGWAYLTGIVIWSYLIVVSLVAGAYAHWRRGRLARPQTAPANSP